MPERIDGGRALAALGALVLIVSLFLDWFKPGITGWTAFEILDLLLTFLALVVIVHAAPGGVARTVRAPEEPSGLFPIAGVAAFVLVAAALINHPPAGVGRSLDTGAWLGFAGATAMAIGGVLSAARVSLVVTVSPRRRPADSEPPAAEAPGPAEPYDPASETETRTLPRSRRR